MSRALAAPAPELETPPDRLWDGIAADIGIGAADLGIGAEAAEAPASTVTRRGLFLGVAAGFVGGALAGLAVSRLLPSPSPPSNARWNSRRSTTRAHPRGGHGSCATVPGSCSTSSSMPTSRIPTGTSRCG
ncbi:hypothetical protein G7085_06740 [Tessaracoccus sp. HDW20]|uniref:hypothetical protein n=1 Tax=Tessaracoccus coleopterorum TaxID=2714950 RepID=UPI0018D48E2C|nr:hypothetical protein [Tessaracoccus coleopterorum]NHB84402.1 hypothetical protein [Tessaracoccus coleopterorum]